MIFYQVNVNCERQTGEDNPCKVKESYLVPATSCAEAERIVAQEIKPFVFGECETPQIKKVQFFDVVRDKSESQYFYQAKVEMITIDSDKEYRRNVNILIMENSINGALVNLLNHLSSYDCEIISIKKTSIIDILNPEDYDLQ